MVPMDSRRVLASFLALSVLTCRDRNQPSSPPDAAASCPESGVGSSDSTEVLRFELLAFAHRWQGAWVLLDADYPGSVQAWDVHGDSVTVYDAARGRSDVDRFALSSPCRVSRSVAIGHDPNLGDGSSEEVTTTDTFVFAADGLHVAVAPAAGGFLRGSLVIACVGDRVYTLERLGGTCRTWTEAMSAPALAPRPECVIDSSPAGPAFVLRRSGWGESVRLPFYGDALLSPELLAHVAETQASFHEAVRRADALAHREAGAPTP